MCEVRFFPLNYLEKSLVFQSCSNEPGIELTKQIKPSIHWKGWLCLDDDYLEVISSVCHQGRGLKILEMMSPSLPLLFQICQPPSKPTHRPLAVGCFLQASTISTGRKMQMWSSGCSSNGSHCMTPFHPEEERAYKELQLPLFSEARAKKISAPTANGTHAL